jgi:hypothetical protein
MSATDSLPVAAVRGSLPLTVETGVFVKVTSSLSRLSIPAWQPQVCPIRDTFLKGESIFGQGDYAKDVRYIRKALLKFTGKLA